MVQGTELPWIALHVYIMDPRSGASQPPTDECLKNIEVMSQPESFRTRQPVNMSKDNGAIVCLLVAIFDHCVVAAVAVALWTRKIIPRQKKISRLKFLRLNWTNLMVIIIWPSNINSIYLSQFCWGIYKLIEQQKLRWMFWRSVNLSLNFIGGVPALLIQRTSLGQ